MCELVLEIGKPSYEVFHSCVTEWGFGFLQFALDTIYALERRGLLERRGQPGNYQLQLFDIFEERYCEALSDILRVNNVRLLALLQLRTG